MSEMKSVWLLKRLWMLKVKNDFSALKNVEVENVKRIDIPKK